jgi:uncharacterized protein (TIGR02118 family)
MIKFVALLKKKDGMSREEFIDYYETKHVPLMSTLLPPFKAYKRNYLIKDEMFVAGHTADASTTPPWFDVITEIWYESRKEYDAMGAMTEDPETGARIKRDEENFLDRGKITMFLVDERIS